MRDLQGSRRLYYLDGLRGWASVSVMVFHELLTVFGPQLLPLTASRALGLLDDGVLAVAIFFVLSAVALSQSFLRTHDRLSLGRLAAGRYLRLTIPIAAASLIALIMLFQGWMHNQAAATVLRQDWLGSLFLVHPSWTSWLHYSFLDALLSFQGMQAYGPFLWTMPIEFAGSLLVFITLWIGGRSRLSRVSVYVIALVSLLPVAPASTIFLFGLMVSEFLASPMVSRLRWAGSLLFALAWIISAVFRQSHTTLVDWMLAVATVLGVGLSPALQGFMQARFSQWLGRISFPLYLTHGLVLCGPMSWGIVRLHAAGWATGEIALAVVPGAVVMSLAAAHLFLPVERVAVQASRWFGGALISTCRGAFRPRLV